MIMLANAEHDRYHYSLHTIQDFPLPPKVRLPFYMIFARAFFGEDFKTLKLIQSSILEWLQI